MAAEIINFSIKTSSLDYKCVICLESTGIRKDTPTELRTRINYVEGLGHMCDFHKSIYQPERFQSYRQLIDERNSGRLKIGGSLN
ncbi:hypothetical protein J4407_03120 [Candidatus Pacearchaeota archaeon]|nr:hypothetical protein [Candidatus Pacearchaeota archaeon]